MNTLFNPALLLDSYKLGHASQYPEGTTLVYSNFTPRSSKHYQGRSQKITWFGLQGFLQELVSAFDQGFFALPKDRCIAEIKRRVAPFVGPMGFDTGGLEELHDLGYLPLRIKALPEGSQVPMGIPVLTIMNTNPRFFWLTNYLETIFSCELWKPTNSATIAREYRGILDHFCGLTGGVPEFTPWQGHDFSMRGMSGVADAASSSAGHLLSFTGTDCLPAVEYLERYYGGLQTFVGGSVPATEHSVMCMGTKESEIETFRRLITKVYPKGVVSIVSDTWDFWKVITEYAKELRGEIEAREVDDFGLAKVVFRPDSGNPVDIICGTDSGIVECVHKGAIECLWDTFGGTINSKGFKVLNPRVGLIYGDSITLERCTEICERLMAKGFCTDNIVLGIGSYTYQYNTRDTFGFAMKSTYGEVKGLGREIFKAPVTDLGCKKSACGLLRVDKDASGTYILTDKCDWYEEAGGCLETVFNAGIFTRLESLETIRKRNLGV